MTERERLLIGHMRELAARECEERAVLNDAVENENDMATDAHTGIVATAGGHRAIEARECAWAIRALPLDVKLADE